MTQVISNPEVLVVFFEEVFTAIASSQNRSVEEAIYPILENNIDQLNLDLIQVLQEKGNALLTQSQPAERIDLASILTKFGDLLNNFNQGKRAKNLEICICCYQIARKLYTRKAYPYEWATIKNKLGLAYSNRLQGNNPQNKEVAIKQLNLALKVFTKNHFPIDWAETQVELAKVYTKRIKQKKLDNCIQAFTILQGALNVYKIENFPYEWAVIQDLLGKVYIIGNINNSRQKDTEQAIKYYRKALEVFTPEIYPSQWAITSTNLSSAYVFGFNNDAEKGVKCCLPLLEIITPEKFSYEWACIQRQLGWFYKQKSEEKNDPKQAIKSIECLKKALDIFTFNNYPEDLAFTNKILATAYFQLFQTKKGQKKHLNLAINACQEALNIFNYDNYPEKWARVQKHLANFYNYDRDNRREKQDLVFQHCENALKVLTAEDFPYEWATVNNYLGNIYRNRIKGNKAENTNLAREHYLKALNVYEEMSLAKDIYIVKTNLGLTHLYSVIEEREESFKKAKQYFEGAEKALNQTNPAKGSVEWIKIKNHLAVIAQKLNNFSNAIKIYREILQFHCQRDDNWAWTQKNLGNLYSHHPDNKDKESPNKKRVNMEKAINAYKQALTVYNQQKTPTQWAQAQNNLGNAYKNLNNKKSAIICFELALKVHTRENYPYQWAKLQNNLGNAYKFYNRGSRKNNINQAIEAYEAALEIRQPKLLPYECFQTAKNLGEFAYRNKKWKIAIKGYSLAVEATEEIRSFSSTDSRRQKVLRERIEVYQNLIKACVNAKETEKAIEYVDRSRARLLVDLTASNDLYSEGEILPTVKNLLQEYEQIEKQIEEDREQFSQHSEQNSNHQVRNIRLEFKEKNDEIRELIEQKQSLWEEIRKHDLVLSAQLQVNALSWNNIHQLIDNSKTAILSFYTTRQDTYIFILYKDKNPQIHICHGQGENHFQKQSIKKSWLVPYQEIFKDKSKKEEFKKKWIKNVNDSLGNISKRLKLDSLVDNHLQGIQELIIIPYLYLHQIPFSALPLLSVYNTEEKTEYLGDKFSIRYVPSCQILQFCQQRESVKQISYGTVEDADGSLPGARIEGEKIARLFNISPEKRLIGKSQATVGNYRQLIKTVEAIHSSHHAVCDPNNPLESALKLADGNITLQQLMTPNWRLPKLHDVFLACCETHLGVTDVTDDILTLATGFLCAGARSVVSSLWVADDLAATLLSIFYHQLRKEGESRSKALQQAQQKLRNLSGEELYHFYEQELKLNLAQQRKQAEALRSKAKKTWKRLSKNAPNYAEVEAEYKRLNKNTERLRNLKELIETLSKRSLPFDNPYYWSVFICSGIS